MFGFRTKSENNYVRNNDVVKYHAEVSKDFDTSAIKAVENYLCHFVKSVVTSAHHKERSIQKHIPDIPFGEYMKNGKCFEYKLVNGSLYRFAVRLEGKGSEDYISVFQPQRVGNKMEVVLITCYANNKNDNHRTLRVGKYAA